MGKIKKILQDLSAQLEIDFNYLERLVSAGSKMFFKESLDSLDRKIINMNVDDALHEEVLVCCAYGAIIDRLATELN